MIEELYTIFGIIVFPDQAFSSLTMVEELYNSSGLRVVVLYDTHNMVEDVYTITGTRVAVFSDKSSSSPTIMVEERYTIIGIINVVSQKLTNLKCNPKING